MVSQHKFLKKNGAWFNTKQELFLIIEKEHGKCICSETFENILKKKYFLTWL